MFSLLELEQHSLCIMALYFRNNRKHTCHRKDWTGCKMPEHHEKAHSAATPLAGMPVTLGLKMFVKDRSPTRSKTETFARDIMVRLACNEVALLHYLVLAEALPSAPYHPRSSRSSMCFLPLR
jgi:hypothetical protein